MLFSKKNQSKTKTKPKKLKPSSSKSVKIGQLEQSEPTLDLSSLANGEIAIAKVLKGTEDKISCLVDIDKTEYVVKASSPYIDDHIINTSIFHKLSIPGVQAPDVVKLTDEFAGKLIKASTSTTDPGAQDLVKALQKGNNQLATLAPGYTIQDIQSFDAESTLLNSIKSKDPFEKTAGALLAQLRTPDSMKKVGSPGNIKFEKLKSDILNAKPNERQAAIDALRDVTVSPAFQTILNVASLSAQGGKAIDQRKSQIADLEKARIALVKQVTSPNGAHSLGGLCMVDLLCGMDDRILSKWNGGNFIFDRKSGDFWCIDNAKNAENGLSAGNDKGWSGFVDSLKAASGKEEIGDVIYFFLYESASVSGEGFVDLITEKNKPAIKAGIDAAVQENLDKFHGLLTDESLDKSVKTRLQARLNILAGKEVAVEPSQPTISTKTAVFTTARPLPTSNASSGPKIMSSRPLTKIVASPKIVAKDTSDDTTSSSSEAPEDTGPSPKILISPSPSPIITSSTSQTPQIVSSPRSSPTIIASPNPTTISPEGLVRRQAFRRQVAEHFDPIDLKTIALAQELWGPTPLPSDPVSQQKIAFAVAWLQSHPTADRLDFVMRLSVQLGINHPDLPGTQ